MRLQREITPGPSVRCIVRLVAGASILLAHAVPVEALHVSTALDVDILRPPMPGEGYLKFVHTRDPNLPLMVPGEELTGWTDIRSPALDGTVDTKRGYDWTDNQVVVRTHNVRVQGGVGDSTITPALRRQDFDVANAVFAQAGITIRQEANVTANGHRLVLDARNSATQSLSDLFGIGRSANSATINVYYVSDIPTFDDVFNVERRNTVLAQTLQPAASATARLNDGIAVADTVRTAQNGGSAAFAHEVGHFLLDTNVFVNQGDRVHSPRSDDLMASGSSGRYPSPTAYKISAERFGLREPGQQVGSIGTTSHFGANVGPPGEPADESQVRSLYNFHVQKNDHGDSFGDRADFDWVEQNAALESAAGAADNHAGAEFMAWKIAPINRSVHLHFSNDSGAFDHQHGNWGELALNDFDKPFFRTIDVASQIARYADMDVGADKQWSARESALDYPAPEFSADGVNWAVGSLVNVFIPGWDSDLEIKADDYVARWSSPVDARFIRFAASPFLPLVGGDHDSNFQIDAIIASQSIVQSIPEPVTFLFTGLGLLCVAALRCGSGTRSDEHCWVGVSDTR